MKGQCGEKITFQKKEIHVTVFCKYEWIDGWKFRITSVKRHKKTCKIGKSYFTKKCEILHKLSITTILELEEAMEGHAGD